MRFLMLCQCVFFTTSVLGQESILYPDMFASFFNQQPLFNPSFQQDTGRIAVTVAVKSRTGAFKNVATYYASLDLIHKGKKGSGHTLRLFFFNEKDGPYIEKPRGYINYAYGLLLARETFLSAGLSGGFAQVAFSAPSSTATGTTTLPDASLGFYLKHKKIKAGVSSMQLFNNSSRPVNALVKLGRYYNFFLSAEKELGYVWKLNAYLLYRDLPAYKDNLDVALLLTYRDFFALGSSARYRQGLSFFASLNINTSASLININFTYNTPFFATISSLNNSFELSPSYILK